MVLGFSGSQLFGVLLALGGVVILSFSGRYIWRTTRIYRAEPVSTLKEATTGGLVQVTGTAHQVDANFFTAPFSGKDCLALRYSIEERRLSPLLLPWFVTIHELSGSKAFGVRTPETTIDIVEPARTVTLSRQVVATTPADAEPPELIERFERTTDAVPATSHWRSPPSFLQPITSRLSLGTRRYTEERTTPGDEVTIIGHVTETGDGVDPVVVSDLPPGQTIFRMAKTSFVGLSIGVFAVMLGTVLIFL